VSRLTRLSALGAAGVGAAALWWRRNPSACPYNQRFWVQAPHPFITRDRLREALGPVEGEHLLEIGPGTGYYALPVAEWLGEGGRLSLLDIQPEFLDHTMQRARDAGLANLEATVADAQDMPFADATFDGAYLATVLGEIPDRDAALRELARVVRPGGRVVFGELFGDPHMVTTRVLRREAEAAGLRFERRHGPPFGFFARFSVP
jgi:ubiquinone/menaquinone biosynthesis C-methylase UbiE